MSGPVNDPPTSFQVLKERVIDSGLCMLCQGCIASCPEDAIGLKGEKITLVGECTNCGTCYRVCPGKGFDFKSAKERVFKRDERGIAGKLYGVHISRRNYRASDDEVFRAGYMGGRVSALLICLLEHGMVDAALLTDWGEGRCLSIGKGRICKDRASVLSCGSSKYLFSPVLTLLKEASADPDITKVVVVGLPCHVQALRNMQADPVASRFTGKVEYVFSLNCGAPNLSDADWRHLLGRQMGVDGTTIRSVNIHKTGGRVLRFRVCSIDGSVKEKEIPLSNYLRTILKYPRWPRCELCSDYSGELSDITFGGPVVRTKKGKDLLESAIASGELRPASRRQVISQAVTDINGYFLKKVGAVMRVKRRKKRGISYPEYIY